MDVIRKLLAEFIGTFFLVLIGIGSGVFSGLFVSREFGPPINIGVGIAGMALAFGLGYAALGYAFGHVSGGHFNPAVSIGAFVGRRLSPLLLLPYVIVQVLGAVAAVVVLYVIATGNDSSPLAGTKNQLLSGFGANGFGDHCPSRDTGYKYDQTSALFTEVLLTFFFVSAAVGAGDRRVPKGFAPLAAGLALTAVYLVGFPVTGVSVNPAKSTGPALLLYLQGGEKWALEQLWVFWAAPLLGGGLAGAVYGILRSDDRAVDVVPVGEERMAYGRRP